MLIECPARLVGSTLQSLRRVGLTRRESVVLWLGHRDPKQITVNVVYRPIQTSTSDMFHIPAEGMKTLHNKLRRNRCMVAAQIHSHPGRAFHSKTDDRWAIIRHEGALSIVLPDYALRTRVTTFIEHAMVYRFTHDGIWTHIQQDELEQSCLRIS